jgi:hypothetical protein
MGPVFRKEPDSCISSLQAQLIVTSYHSKSWNIEKNARCLKYILGEANRLQSLNNSLRMSYQAIHTHIKYV